ncbi:MAG: urease subunit gamma [Labilithrix sp.]|nr:urease subunit gamma [Labilithrix sp.]MCW5814173.1 urease subunit gamma [Labilithrix sp.]
MHLSPRDLDKLLLHGAGFLAQKRLARGLRLNYPESVALLSTQLLEFVRDGEHSVADLMDLGRRLLGRRQVLPGVPRLIHEVQVEGTFEDGTKLITVHDPISLDDGDLALALYGSFLPVPDPKVFADVAEDVHAGEVILGGGDVELYPGRERVILEVTSKGDRPIQVGSHYPFEQTNAALDFDRALATDKHLDIPAGTAVRFEPGETRKVALVANAPSETAVRSLTPEQIAQQYDRASGKLPDMPAMKEPAR